jgi:hypothetical protein
MLSAVLAKHTPAAAVISSIAAFGAPRSLPTTLHLTRRPTLARPTTLARRLSSSQCQPPSAAAKRTLSTHNTTSAIAAGSDPFVVAPKPTVAMAASAASAAENKGSELSAFTQGIVEQLLVGVANKDESTPLSALLKRSEWRVMGDLVSAAERGPRVNVPGECWYSLRLDGTAFGKHLKHLKRAG